MQVLVYGANGQLGESVVAALRQRGHHLTLGGRNENRLRELALPNEGVVTGEPDAVLREVEVAVNCAPTTLAETDRLVGAALSHRAHFVDLGGDQDRIRHLLEAHHRDARRAQRCVVPALGFDYAVGDCLARVAASHGGQCDEVVVAYALEGAQAAANSLEFATEGPRAPEVVYRDFQWRSVPWELDGGSFQFPPPFGRQKVGRYGAGEVITVPRHTQARNVRTLITARSLVPHPALLPFFPVLRPLVALALRTPLRHLIGWLGRLLGGSAPSEPPQGLPKGPGFAVVAEVFNGNRRLARSAATGEDCYLTTAEVVAVGVELLLAGQHRASGALSPAVVFDPAHFLDQLTSCRWEIQ